MDNDKLMEYISRILAEHEGLSVENDMELLTITAEIMKAGDDHVCPGDVDEALEDARKELSGETEKRAVAAMESLKNELELRGLPDKSASEMIDEIMEQEADSGKNVGDPVNAAMAKAILKRQAESLWKEKSVVDVHYFEDGRLWRAVVRFRSGQLTKEAQNTLTKMKHNAHRTMMTNHEGMDAVTFIVVG